MEKHEHVSTEVPSYGLLSTLGSFLVDTALPAATNFVTQTVPNAIGDFATQGLSGLYTNADKLLGGILPNIGGAGQAFGQGYLGQLYTGADKMLGGYLPNIGGGAANGMGAGFTPQYMSAQRAFDALPGTSVGAGQVGTSFMGGPMSVSSVNTPLASGGMSGFDKLAMGIQGAGLLGAMLSGDKGTAQAAMMYPGQLAPGAGRTQSPLAQTIKQDPVMQSGGTGVSSRGQGANKTPGMAQVTAGTTDEMVGQIQSTIEDLEKTIEEFGKVSFGEEEEEKPMEQARKSGLGMDTGNKSYFSMSGTF